MLATRRRLAGGGAMVLLLAVTTTTRVAIADSVCSTVVCGKGNCTVTSWFSRYRCECELGWTQMHVGDEFTFLPCVIPNCSLDRTCSNTTSAPAAALVLPPKNFYPSPDPYYGARGTCKNGTGLSYHCECNDGFSNLMNITTMPCFQNCSISADCASIGILPFS